MRVLLTGGTGYVGAHTVAALLAAGHEPRLLIRSRERLSRNVAPLGVGVDSLDLVLGDMTDRDSVVAALRGMDAVIHAAAVIAAFNRTAGAKALVANVEGTKNVIGAALDAGVRRAIHVSSTAAIFDPKATLLTADLPPAIDADSPYTRSKALSDAWVREQQDAGAPVTIVYPGGVSGPPAGEAMGEVAEGFVSMLRAGVVVLSGGRITIIDVRDVARILVAALGTTDGPHRFMAGGRLTTLHEIGAVLRRHTGRRMPVLPAPGVVFRGLGRATDTIRRVVPFDTIFTGEAMDLLTLAQPTDDGPVHQQLGVAYRDHEETIEDMVRGLHLAGRLTARQAGALSR